MRRIPRGLHKNVERAVREKIEKRKEVSVMQAEASRYSVILAKSAAENAKAQLNQGHVGSAGNFIDLSVLRMTEAEEEIRKTKDKITKV